MPSEEDQTQVRVAWLYHMEGLTQAEVAERLKITRLRVNRLLFEARANGVVNISLNSPLVDCVRLERALARDWGLKDAVVVPTPQQLDLVPPIIGRAAGEYLGRLFDKLRPRGFGVGWGATLRETIRHVRTSRHPKLVVSSMMGGSPTVPSSTPLRRPATWRAGSARSVITLRHPSMPEPRIAGHHPGARRVPGGV